MKGKIKNKISWMGHWFKRINQMLVVFPVWLAIGIPGALVKLPENGKWKKSEKNKKYTSMY